MEQTFLSKLKSKIKSIIFDLPFSDYDKIKDQTPDEIKLQNIESINKSNKYSVKSLLLLKIFENDHNLFTSNEDLEVYYSYKFYNKFSIMTFVLLNFPFYSFFSYQLYFHKKFFLKTFCFNIVFTLLAYITVRQLAENRKFQLCTKYDYLLDLEELINYKQ